MTRQPDSASAFSLAVKLDALASASAFSKASSSYTRQIRVTSRRKVLPGLNHERISKRTVAVAHCHRRATTLAGANCPVCRENSTVFNYGLGVVNLGPWITQTKEFAGSAATVAYLASRKLTVRVATTFRSGAFDDQGNYTKASAKASPSIVIS
jgi:hypothetical protein